MRVALLLPLAFLAVACGSSTASHPLGPAPPRSSAGPPPAWVETEAGNYWLGFSSWCWEHSENGNRSVGLCADMIAPKCSQQGTPNISVAKGERVRAHLGYTPSEASVDNADARLEGRTVTWRVNEPGVFALFTRGQNNDASYVGCGVLP